MTEGHFSTQLMIRSAACWWQCLTKGQKEEARLQKQEAGLPSWSEGEEELAEAGLGRFKAEGLGAGRFSIARKGYRLPPPDSRHVWEIGGQWVWNRAGTVADLRFLGCILLKRWGLIPLRRGVEVGTSWCKKGETFSC